MTVGYMKGHAMKIDGRKTDVALHILNLN